MAKKRGFLGSLFRFGGSRSVALSPVAIQTIDDADAIDAKLLKLTGTLSAATTVVIEGDEGDDRTVENQTAQDVLVVARGGGTGVTLTPGQRRGMLVSNGAYVDAQAGVAQLLSHVASRAALLGLSVASGAAGLLSGYGGAIGDGAGGFMAWDPTDTGTVIEGIRDTLTPSDAGRWKRIYTGPISVKWFGAKGDGVTNDTAAIVKAKNAARVLGASLFWPAGVYLTDLVTFAQEDSGLHMHGEGRAGQYGLIGSTIRLRTGTDALFDITGYRFKFSHLTLDGDFLPGRMVRMNNGTSDVLFEDVAVHRMAEGTGRAFEFAGTLEISNIRILRPTLACDLFDASKRAGALFYNYNSNAFDIHVEHILAWGAERISDESQGGINFRHFEFFDYGLEMQQVGPGALVSLHGATPAGTYAGAVEILSDGITGVATYRYTTDGGAHWSGPHTSADDVPFVDTADGVTDTGLAFSFTARGSYETGTTYAFNTVPGLGGIEAIGACFHVGTYTQPRELKGGYTEQCNADFYVVQGTAGVSVAGTVTLDDIAINAASTIKLICTQPHVLRNVRTGGNIDVAPMPVHGKYFVADQGVTFLTVGHGFTGSGALTHVDRTMGYENGVLINRRLPAARAYLEATADMNINAMYGVAPADPLDIEEATAATPIALKVTAHGLLTGAPVDVANLVAAGITGAPDGRYTATRVDADHISLNGTTGGGAYTGGAVVRPVVNVCETAFVDGLTADRTAPLSAVGAPVGHLMRLSMKGAATAYSLTLTWAGSPLITLSASGVPWCLLQRSTSGWIVLQDAAPVYPQRLGSARFTGTAGGLVITNMKGAAVTAGARDAAGVYHAVKPSWPGATTRITHAMIGSAGLGVVTFDHLSDTDLFVIFGDVGTPTLIDGLACDVVFWKDG